MSLKSLLAVTALVFPMSSFALGPINPLDRVVVKTEQFKGVNYLLEQGLGRPLTASERAQLARAIPNGPVDGGDDLIIKVSNGPQEKTYALYCIGLAGAFVGKISGAVCASLQTMKSYTLGFIGIGEAVQADADFFRLAITFDSAGDDKSFDPIPGSYLLATTGMTVFGGGTGFVGTAGNKELYGVGLNIGLGLDLGTVAGLYIR